MSRVYGYRWNPEPEDNPGEEWRERRREQLSEDLSFISAELLDCPLLWHTDTHKYTRGDGTTHITPADHRGAKTLKALIDGSDAEVLAAVRELRAFVDDKITEQAQDDWQDHLDSAGEP